MVLYLLFHFQIFIRGMAGWFNSCMCLDIRTKGKYATGPFCYHTWINNSTLFKQLSSKGAWRFRSACRLRVCISWYYWILTVENMIWGGLVKDIHGFCAACFFLLIYSMISHWVMPLYIIIIELSLEIAVCLIRLYWFVMEFEIFYFLAVPATTRFLIHKLSQQTHNKRRKMDKNDLSLTFL